jgi:hypothetical protein
MNERIKELLEQATKHYPATESSGEFSTFDKEKFAELIIRECSDVVNYYHSRNEPITSRQILQHFGVKE